jgi:hypothetical protein
VFTDASRSRQLGLWCELIHTGQEKESVSHWRKLWPRLEIANGRSRKAFFPRFWNQHLMFWGAGLLVSVLFATCGLDLSPGFSNGRRSPDD